MIDPEVMRRLEQQASLIRQLQGALGGLRVVRGSVDGTGTASVTAGEGFSLTDNGTGDYTITFDVPFSDVPSVVISPGASAFLQVVKHHVSVPPSETGFRLLSFTTAAVATDGLFEFVAIGPA